MAMRHSSAPCNAFEQDLVLYHYGECSEVEKQTLEAHLENCVACRSFLQELKTLLPSTVEVDQPSSVFWQDYSRELRLKLDAQSEKGRWWQTIAVLFRPWPVPALATAAILAIGITMTMTKSSDSPSKPDGQEYSYMASNADFFKSMDLLDSMDLLESVEASEAQKGEAAAQHL
jgi:predicted anti-sigma-YlaC factor YlaD